MAALHSNKLAVTVNTLNKINKFPDPGKPTKKPLSKEEFQNALDFIITVFTNEKLTEKCKEDAGSGVFTELFINRSKPLSKTRWKKLISTVLTNANDDGVFMFIDFISGCLESYLEYGSKYNIDVDLYRYFYDELIKRFDLSQLYARDLATVFPLNKSHMNHEFGDLIIEYLNKIDLSKQVFLEFAATIKYPGFSYRGYKNIYFVNNDLVDFVKEIPGMPIDEFLYEDDIDDYT